MRAERFPGMASGGCRTWLLGLLASVLFALSAGAAIPQRTFDSPEDAAQALIQSVKAHDRPATLEVLGPQASGWISSGDVAADNAAIERFIAAYDAKHAIVRDGDKATLTLGQDDFPFAFPIVRVGGRWHFDTAAGKEEMLARRIGENELSAIEVMRAVVDAQLEYASEDRNGDGVLAYAQKFASSPGKHDGLYWPTKAGEAESPLGELMVKAAAEGYSKQGRKISGAVPYHGYYYRMLMGQTKNAESGALNYVVHGHAIGGFATLAYPARYGNSGIMTFIVNQDGKIYQADLGPNTVVRAREIQKFDPGKAWTLVPGK